MTRSSTARGYVRRRVQVLGGRRWKNTSSTRGISPSRSSETVWIKPGVTIVARKMAVTKRCARRSIGTAGNLEFVYILNFDDRRRRLRRRDSPDGLVPRPELTWIAWEGTPIAGDRFPCDRGGVYPAIITRS